MPRFSIVIAAFNAAKWIVPTIRSALRQTYPACEIIVVGDGCTDPTGELLESHFGNAVRWKNLDRNSGGQSYPNNEGIRLSGGTHIAYLGHDDIWSPHHLEQLARVVREHDPDFAVSGAIYHGPPGSRYYQITGLFDDPRAAKNEFFPPSSFAHRRDVVEWTGVWCDPNELRAPADCEFLLRAARLGCSFVSTQTITVHKFAAGQRYLSYRFASGLEQERMLGRLSAPDGEAQVLEEIQKEIADGAEHPPIRYLDFDRFSAGELFRTNRRARGLEKPLPILVDKPVWLKVERFAAGLDWYDLEKHPLYGTYRWSGPNPNPLHLVNVRVLCGFLLRVRVLAFAAEDLAGLLELDVNDRPVAFARERDAAGVHILTVGPLAGPVDDGLVLRFRLPHCAHLPSDSYGRRAGLALSGIEIVPLP